LQRHLIVVNVPRIAFAAEREISNASLFATEQNTAKESMDTIATKGEELLTEFWAKVWNPPYDLDTIDRLCTEESLSRAPAPTSWGEPHSRNGSTP
jgi:hypothetical protein